MNKYDAAVRIAGMAVLAYVVKAYLEAGKRQRV